MELETGRLSKIIQDLEETIEEKDKTRKSLLFTYGRIQHNSGRVSFYTGSPDGISFESFFQFLEPMARQMDYRGTKKLKEGRAKPGPCRKLPLIEEFLMTCMRLKVGLLEADLAERFKYQYVLFQEPSLLGYVGCIAF